jgi:hypothetical protein
MRTNALFLTPRKPERPENPLGHIFDIAAFAAWRGWLVLVLSASVTGCLAPRKSTPLAASAQPLEHVAILPVETPAKYEKTSFTPARVIQNGNDVFDTLAKAKDGHLIGPSKVASLLGSNGFPAFLRWETAAKDIGAQSNIVAANQLANLLGVRQVVRTRIHIPKTSTTWAGDGAGCVWESSYSVFVDLELINLDPLTVETTSSGGGSAHQTTGIFMIIPFGYGTTFDGALDQAQRNALTLLFNREQAGATQKCASSPSSFIKETAPETKHRYQGKDEHLLTGPPQ